ncbi:SEC-15 protein [Aphelenchoides besseyi]|nr:SEC-15 protein [Aphelenchoides besseyi]
MNEKTNGSVVPEMTAEQEFFLYELETTDSASVGLVLRAIYDSGDVDKFTRALERRIANYDKNILKVCTYHYQGFLDSLNDLTTLGGRCSEIKSMAKDVDDQIQHDGSELQSISSDIVKYRKMQRNASVAIDQISMCLPVLDNYVKLQELMKQKKFLQALKVLEDLEHNYFPHIHKYRFTQTLAKGVLPIRKQIRDSSYSELTDFLENLQKISGNVGSDASKHVRFESGTKIADQYTNFTPSSKTTKTPRDGQQRKQTTEIQFDDHGAIVRQASQTSMPPKAKNDDEAEEEGSVQDRIDFAPIHRCCQVFNVLGEKDAFERYYREQRREQCLVISQTPSKFAESIHIYVKYLNDVMGFFIVEDRIMQIQPTLVTVAHKDQLWEMALQKVTTAMNSHFGNCLNVEMMMRMKKVILLFILTMKSYGYSITPLYSLLQNFRDQYNEILMREYCAQFDVALQNDNYTPLVVNNEEEYRAVLQDFPHYKRKQETENFPRSFPFSNFVPKVFRQAKQYLKGCLGFMENLQLSQSEIEDTVRRYANVLLARWSGSLKSFVMDNSRSLIQLVQITINVGYLEKSCDSLERYISKITSQGDAVGGGSSHLVTLNDHVFQDLRSEVEQLIDEALRNKVNAFLELANYDWELPESSGVASGYITDLCSFLRTTFHSFTNLPPVLARHVCMQTCKYLADRLHSLLLSADYNTISKGALEQFSLDEMQCEDFAAKAPVGGFDESTLPMTFAHLRQLLDLVINEDWTTYLSNRNQPNFPYNRVKAIDAAMLLEKLLEFEKKSSGFFGIGRTQDRRRLYEAILRQLRAVMN